MVKQRPTLLQDVKDEIFDGHFSQRRGFVQIADDFSTEYPEVIGMFANGLPAEIQTDQMLEERKEVLHYLFPRWKVLLKPYSIARRVWQVPAVLRQICGLLGCAMVYGGSPGHATDNDSKPLPSFSGICLRGREVLPLRAAAHHRSARPAESGFGGDLFRLPPAGRWLRSSFRASV